MRVDIGDFFARISNGGIPEDEAAAMIEEAALSAADQVRKHAYHVRATEKDLQACRKERDELQRLEAANNMAFIKKQEDESRERNAKLKEVEVIGVRTQSRPIW